MSRLNAYIKPFPRAVHHCLFSTKTSLNRPTRTTTSYDFAKSAPKERAHVRLPIVINGAGPAGLMLAIGLKNARIPFEICERQRHDLPSKLRRNNASLLLANVFNPLKKFLNAPDYESFLSEIAIPQSTSKGNMKCDQRIYTEAFLDLLRREVPVNYGYKLQHDGISCLESVVTSKYIAGQTVRTLQGSLLVGADGKFSAVRNTFNLSAWPAITYVSTIVISKQQFESDLEPDLDDVAGGGKSSTRLFGHTRLMLCVNGMTRTHVNLSLWYSRMITSNEDFHNFWGHSAEEREILRVEYEYDSMIKDEIDSLLPLPPPFEKAYKLCTSSGIHRRSSLNCVRTGGRELTTEINRDNLTMPAVLIGDAAHAIPEMFSPADINRALWDAIELCCMIVERYDDDDTFSTIPEDFYASQSVHWQKLPKEWARKWMEAHGIPFDYQADSRIWVKLRRTVRLGGHYNQSEIKIDNFPVDRQHTILGFKEREEARWEAIQKRISNRFVMKHAFKPQPGVESSEIVLRYLDSRPDPEHDEPKAVADHDSDDEETDRLLPTIRKTFID